MIYPLARPATLAFALCAVAACQGGYSPEAPATADLSTELIRSRNPHAPPPQGGGPNQCWAKDVTPAVIETVTEQVVVSPAVQDANGAILTPASFRSVTHQKIIKDREAVHFRTPCPRDMTVEFIATLQRALKARGYYLLPLTGEMDAATRDAIRRFQEKLGLDSPVLSLGGARALGISNADLEAL